MQYIEHKEKKSRKNDINTGCCWNKFSEFKSLESSDSEQRNEGDQGDPGRTRKTTGQPEEACGRYRSKTENQSRSSLAWKKTQVRLAPSSPHRTWPSTSRRGNVVRSRLLWKETDPESAPHQAVDVHAQVPVPEPIRQNLTPSSLQSQRRCAKHAEITVSVEIVTSFRFFPSRRLPARWIFKHGDQTTSLRIPYRAASRDFQAR